MLCSELKDHFVSLYCVVTFFFSDSDIRMLQAEEAKERAIDVAMPELDTVSMADVHVLRFRFGPATARRPGQCDHDCDTRGCQNGCVLEMYHDHGNPEPHSVSNAYLVNRRQWLI